MSWPQSHLSVSLCLWPSSQKVKGYAPLGGSSNSKSIYRILFLDLCPAALRAKLNGLSIYRILFIEIALRGHARPHATIVKYAVSPQSNRPGMGELATSRGVKSSGKSADYFLRHLPLSAGGACQWPIYFRKLAQRH